ADFLQSLIGCFFVANIGIESPIALENCADFLHRRLEGIGLRRRGRRLGLYNRRRRRRRRSSTGRGRRRAAATNDDEQSEGKLYERMQNSHLVQTSPAIGSP